MTKCENMEFPVKQGGAVTVELDSFTTILFIVNMYESVLNLS